MKFSEASRLLCSILAVVLIVDQAKSAELSQSEKTANVDLNPLISILDGHDTQNGEDHSQVLTTTPTLKAQSETRVTPIPPKYIKQIRVIKKKRVKVKRPFASSTTTSKPETTEAFTELTTTTTSSTTSTTTTTERSTSTLPPSPQSSTVPISTLEDINPSDPEQTFQRRQDSNIEKLQEIASPSQQELVQQLSLLNTLISSLGDNAASARAVDPVGTIPATETSKSLVTSPSQKLANPSNDLQSAAVSALLGLGAGGSNANPASETEATKALSEFLLQAAAIEGQRSNGFANNVQTNLNDATTASNQITSLVSLLGALNSASPQGAGQGSPSNANVLEMLMRSQREQAQGNSLFNQQPQFDFASLLGSSQAQGSGSSLGGIGSGIISTIGSGLGSLGTSIASTVSNIFSGNAFGGKPRLRGMDTRVGLGYRFGDTGDAQIIWDMGPQLFTDPIKNEMRNPSAPPVSKKSHNVDVDPTEELINSLLDHGKNQADSSAAKRLLSLQKGMKSHHLNQKQFTPTQVTPKKPLSLLDIWNVGKEPKESVLQIPDQLLTPPLAINEADRFQMERSKSFKKRSSLKNYYAKPIDDPLGGHSTLTTYEKMLLNHGKDVGVNFAEEDQHLRQPKRPNSRGKPLPVLRDIEASLIAEPEYGQEIPLEKRPKPKRKQKVKLFETVVKRPSKKRPRPSDKHKWKPRGQDDDYGEEGLKEDYPENEEPIKQPPKSSSRERSREREHSRERPSSSREKSRDEEYEDKLAFSEDVDVGAEPDERPSPNREDFIHIRTRSKEQDASGSDSKPKKFNYNPYDEFESQDMQSEYEETSHGPRERPYDDGSDGYGPRKKEQSRSKEVKNKHKTLDEEYGQGQEDYKPRPKARRPPRPKQNGVKNLYPVHQKKKKPKFSLAKIFHYWRVGGRRHQKKPLTERRRDQDGNSADEEPFEKFAYKQPQPRFRQKARPRSDDGEIFLADRRRQRPHRPYRSRFQQRTSHYYQPFSPEMNPEANDSFLRRNQIAVSARTKLRENNQNKKHQNLLESESSMSPQSESETENEPENILDIMNSNIPSPIPPPSPTNPVMSFVRNYISSKSKNHYNNHNHHTPSNPRRKSDHVHHTNPHSISSLAQLLTNPSLLNPLKILPIRRDRRPPRPKVKAQLAYVNGKLRLVNATITSNPTTTPEPIIHLGEDMSFDELTQVLSAVTKKGNKKKLKVKLRKPSPEETERRRDPLTTEEDSEERAANDSIIPDSEPEATNNAVEEQEDDINEGLKGIYIDIESGEVEVLKPVAKLSSFEPKKEEPEKKPNPLLLDEMDDEDGDGIPNVEIQRKEEIFSAIQKELKRNYNEMKKVHDKAEAKKKRKEELESQGLDESVGVVSKYFDIVQDESEEDSQKAPKLSFTLA